MTEDYDHRRMLSNDHEVRKSRKKMFHEKHDEIFKVIGTDGQTQTSPLKQTSTFESQEDITKDLFNSKSMPKTLVTEFTKQRVISKSKPKKYEETKTEFEHFEQQIDKDNVTITFIQPLIDI